MRQPPRADATTVRCKTVQRKTKEQQSNFWLSVFAAIAIVIAVAIAAIVLRKKIPSKCEACSVPCFLFLLLTLFVNTMCAPSIVLHSACMSIACITHTHTHVYYTLYNTPSLYTVETLQRLCAGYFSNRQSLGNTASKPTKFHRALKFQFLFKTFSNCETRLFVKRKFFVADSQSFSKSLTQCMFYKGGLIRWYAVQKRGLVNAMLF